MGISLTTHVNVRMRSPERLCSGQNFLCSSPCLTMPDYNSHSLKQNKLALHDVGHYRSRLVQCKQLTAPEGSKQHLRSRFVDYGYTRPATTNLTVDEYTIIELARSFTKTCPEVRWVSAFVLPIYRVHQAAPVDLLIQAFSV